MTNQLETDHHYQPNHRIITGISHNHQTIGINPKPQLHPILLTHLTHSILDLMVNKFSNIFNLSATPTQNKKISQIFTFIARQSDPATNPGCKTITGDTFEIQLEDPCDDADTISECAPLWISIYAPLQNSDTISATCKFYKS